MTSKEQSIEQVSRILCAKRGLPPDELVGHGIEGSGAWHYSFQWVLVANEVRVWLQIKEAFDQVANAALSGTGQQDSDKRNVNPGFRSNA